MIHARVDLPEPLPPWIRSPSPSLTVKLMSCRAVLAHGVSRKYSWPTPSRRNTGTLLCEVWITVGAGAAASSTMTMLSADSLRLTVRSAISVSLL